MKKLIVVSVALVVAAGIAVAQPPTPLGLAGLDLVADKTDIEHMRVPFNEPFSPARLNYSVTIDQTFTKNVFLRPRVSAGQSGSVKINGAEVTPGDLHRIEIQAGENKFTVTLAPKGAGAPTTYNVTVIQKDQSKEYRSELLGPGIWRIQDFGGSVGNEDMYLFEGKERSLLFDTGMGRGNLPQFLWKLTKHPIDVAITHGHGDHFRQLDQFPEATVYIHKSDITRLPAELTGRKFTFIKDGDVIDIGAGRKFEVLEVPGHSLGSVLFVDFANAVAVTGDAISSGSMVYMFGSSCTALDQYLGALTRAEARVKPLPGLTLLAGHHYQEKVPLTGTTGRQLITDMRTAAEQVLRGQLTGTSVLTGPEGRRSELRQATVGLAGLWYNPVNLVSDPAALGLLELETAAGTPVVPRPVFSSLQTTYTSVVPADVTTIRVIPTAYWPNHKSVAVNGKTVPSGSPATIDLASTETKVEVVVTPAGGSTRTYTITITKAVAATSSEP